MTDCESIDAQLIDLVENELDDTRAAEVRAHAASCESCGRALARLEGGQRAARELVRAEPPRLDAVMAAARAKAAEIRAAAQASTESAAPPEAPAAPPRERSWLDAALHWLATWATGPQVAMAALLVLMVGIGVYNLPQFRAREGSDADGALVEPDVRAELGPSSALHPADPLTLQVDPRSQRVALGTGTGTDQAPAHDERPTTTLAEATPPPSTDTRAHERTLPTEGPGPVEGTPSEATAPDRDVAPELAALDLAPSDTAGRVEDGPLPDVAPATEGQAIVVAPTPSSTPPAATSRPPVRPSPSYDEVEPPSTSMASALPAAIHRQARALAGAGHCDQAVPRYRSLLAEHPDYADAPRAMIELAECDRRLGRIDEAERWLTRAETFPSVAADARRARVRIDAEQRALERPLAPAAVDSHQATSAPESAY